jgi:hypothetical protein
VKREKFCRLHDAMFKGRCPRCVRAQQDAFFAQIVRRGLDAVSKPASVAVQPRPEPEPVQGEGMARDDWERPSEEQYLR